MIRILTLLLMSVAVMTGCSSTKKMAEEQVIENDVLEYSFVVDENYQAVYRKLLKQAKACVKPGVTAQMVVEGELFEDIKAADVTVVLYGIFSQYPHLHIAIESLEPEGSSQYKTKVSVSNKLPRWNSYARAIKTWIVDGSITCELPN